MKIGQIASEMRRSQPQLGLHKESTISTTSSTSPNNDCDQIDFRRENETDSEAVSVSDQVNSYLSLKLDSTAILAQYSAVAEAFKKCNTTLLSFTVVELLISVTSHILAKKRCRISDSNFAKLVFLYHNLK